MTITRYTEDVMPVKVIQATDFKAKCLSYLDGAEMHGETITITRHGIPVAVLSPVPKAAAKSPANMFAGMVTEVGDIVHADTTHLWEALQPEEA